MEAMQQTAAPSCGPKFNALKHGLYAETIVLPDEDLAAFRHSRQLAFLEFRPQTVDEAELVDALVECRWQWKRCRALQRDADEQTLHLGRDAAGRLAEPLTHQRTHTSMDVTVHRNRIDKLESRIRGKLHERQKMRRLGLMEGAVRLSPGCYMETDGEVVQVIEAPRLPTRVCQVSEVLPQPRAQAGVSASSDKADGFREEQQKTGAAVSVIPRTLPFPVSTPRSDWPLHVASAAWMGAPVGVGAPSSAGWTR